MKICFVISSLTGGGAARVVSILASWLSDKHQINIITLDKNPSFYPINESVEIIPLDLIDNKKGIGNAAVRNRKRVLALRAQFKHLKPDVLISFITETNVLCLLANKGLNIKLIISERSDPNRKDLSRVWGLLRSMTYSKANAIVCQTKRVLEAVDYGIAKSEVIPNPIEVKEIEFNKEPIILFAGRFHKAKGVDFLPEILERLESPNWKVLIAGEGSLRPQIESEVNQLNLPYEVQFLGQVKEIESLYKKAAIFILPSRREGFPNSLLEAMHFGCAPVAFDCNYGPAELIANGENGFLVTSGDVNLLSEKINELVVSELDRTLFGEKARQKSSEYSTEQIGQKWLKLIEQL